MVLPSRNLPYPTSEGVTLMAGQSQLQRLRLKCLENGAKQARRHIESWLLRLAPGRVVRLQQSAPLVHEARLKAIRP
jgi:hypothetical protein